MDARPPGLQIGGKTYKVEIIAKDSQTDESRTAEVASELILKDKVDIITASSGSMDCNPTANVAELNEVPCITADDPWESYYYGRNPPKEGFTWTYHFFWGLDACCSKAAISPVCRRPSAAVSASPARSRFRSRSAACRCSKIWSSPALSPRAGAFGAD